MEKVIKRILVYASNNITIQFLRYAIVGGIASVVDISMFQLMANVVHINHIVANCISFVFGLLVNYFLSRKWVFNQQVYNFAKDFFLFTVIGVLGLMLSNLILYILVDCRVLYALLTFLSEDMIKLSSKLISVFLVLFWNFIARKMIIFK